MSLYVLGRIHCPPSESGSIADSLSSSMASAGISVRFEDFEEDERRYLLARGYPWPTGIEFQLSDRAESVDATGLWNEAMVGCRKVFGTIQNTDPSTITSSVAASIALPDEYFSAAAQTRLGHAVGVVVDRVGVSGGVIALVEGGIERVEYGQKRQVIERILRFLLLPWDCIPNIAYVWHA